MYWFPLPASGIIFQETFYEDRELYTALLAPVVTDAVSTTYVRVADDSEEVRMAVEKIRGVVVCGQPNQRCGI